MAIIDHRYPMTGVNDDKQSILDLIHRQRLSVPNAG